MGETIVDRLLCEALTMRTQQVWILIATGCWPGTLTSLKGSTLPCVTFQKFWDGFEVANMSSLSEQVCGHLTGVTGTASFLSPVWGQQDLGVRCSCSPAEC